MALASPPMHRNAFRVAIICALPLEAEMVQAALDRNWTNEGYKFHKIGGDTNAYTTGLIGEHNVVLAHMARVGNNTAATTASGLRSTFRRLEMIFLVGICGAAPVHPETAEEVILGDCILSTAVIQFDYGRQFDNIFVRKKGLEENLSKANSETQALTARLKITQNRTRLTERMVFHLAQLQHIQRFDYPGSAFDRLYPASYPHKHYDTRGTCDKCYQDADGCSLDCLTLHCDSAQLIRRNRLCNKDTGSKPPPCIHFGRIGSANSILRSAAMRDELAKKDKVVGFEMECAGIWDVLPTVLIKSVCDYADSHKNKDWQPYAAASAAACLKALFEQWETSEPSPTTPTAVEQWISDRAPVAQDTGSQYGSIPTRQSLGHLVYRMKEIDRVLKTPAYEDPLTHNSSLCLDGTAKWIFENDIYQKWLHSNSPSTASFLWLLAGAGTGKTILCTSVINSLKSDPALNVFHYFSSAHLDSNTDLSNIARYWISEIARVDDSATQTSMLTLVETILFQYGAGRTVASTDVWRIFGILVSHLSNCILVLDGLDEYNRTAREQLLVNLKSQLAGKCVKVLITSRDESDIRMELSLAPTDYPGLSFDMLGITRNDTRSDISLLSESLLTRKLTRKGPAFRSALANTLSERSDGMFLWVRLTSNSLHSGQTSAMLQRIVEKAPAGLSSAYATKWNDIMQHPEPEEKSRAIAVLRWCTYALEPLTVAQIAEAVAVDLQDEGDDFDHNELPEDIDEEFIIQGIKGLCSSFIELRPSYSTQPLSDQRLHLVHSSVKDFLLLVLPGTRTRGFPADSSISTHMREHLELSKICLRYLCYKNVTPPISTENDTNRRFYEYAKRQWHLHQAKSELEDKEFVQLVLRFLDPKCPNLMDWIPVIEAPGARSLATPIYYAAHLGLVSVLDEIHKRNPESIDSVGGYLGTALQATCASNHEKAIDLLLSWNADTGIRAGRWGNALAASVASGNPEITRKLLSRGADPNQRRDSDETPLSYAVRYNELQCAAVLLDGGANASLISRGSTPISLAIHFGYLEMTRLLLERGVNVNENCNLDETPLIMALQLADVQMTKLLLKHGADLEAVHNGVETPLMVAVRLGYIDIVGLLLEHGANSMSRTIPTGDLPIHFAVRHKTPETVCYTTAREMVKLLLEHSTLDPSEYINNEGRTLLQDAAFMGNIEAFDYLISRGFNPAQKDKHGNGVLESCCVSEKPDLLERLLQAPDKLLENNNTSGTWSPLHWASICGSFKIVQCLADVGFKISSVTTSTPQAEWAPLDIARFYRNLNLVQRDGEVKQSHPWDSIRDSGIVVIDESSTSIKAVSHNSFGFGIRQSRYVCAGCRVYSVAPRFRSLTRDNLEYCILCKHTAERNGLHPGDHWEYTG